ncbi:hypothetical protein [Xenorhabdus sp. PB30.3]|uniref:hypothetical protein n=1 Tax=Xenorhabdus sp. PB30.3 TaxID=2788941 RepID=UPI001E3AD024|nr:hypothetical protein [Xenorhabdus sp. PB30.3]MCC8379384.1 hypothetical protein [Xenorhabdus sp. PB30.3]
MTTNDISSAPTPSFPFIDTLFDYAAFLEQVESQQAIGHLPDSQQHQQWDVSGLVH